jgi:hypothetical protein
LNEGFYEHACRPNLRQFADDYIADNPGQMLALPPTQAQLEGASGVSVLYGYNAGGTPLSVPALPNVRGRVTLYVIGDVRLTGNIAYANGAVSRNNLPGFGIIATGRILIDPLVGSIEGYYFAEGHVDTCNGVNIATNAALCNNQLTVNGLMSAGDFRFKRTFPLNPAIIAPSERINFLGDLFLAPPPAFSDVFSLRATRSRDVGERPPFY